MELIAFSLEGYKRFLEKTSVKLHGNLIAFVGPNEAGKSSLLYALTHLHRDEPFSTSEAPRRKNVTPKLSWHFQLNSDDKRLLEEVHDASHIERVVITKVQEGSKTWRFEPRSPQRDRTPRMLGLRSLQQQRPQLVRLSPPDFEFDRLDKIENILQSDLDSLPQVDIDSLRELAGAISQIEWPNEGPAENDGESNRAESFYAARDGLVSALNDVADREAEAAPIRKAIDVLSERVPKIFLFADSDRNLASEYDLAEVAQDPPSALYHLTFLADLNLRALLKEVNANSIADVSTRRNAANRRLLDAFDKSWNQQGIAIQLDIQGRLLHIQATTPEDAGLSPIVERSDGMRWFAALLAFSYGWAENSVLLVDEIETHLHYDAQSDLIEVLSKQQYATKVIYTTHSFGCLPHDLGTGVRVVEPIDAARSRLENGFWKSGAGFSPLLASMGAAASSITPTRYALIAEGASDAILLPTLLRQACEISSLGFQIAPGLAGVAALAVPSLDVEAGRVAFVVDGDEGGEAHAAKLRRAGVPSERIVVLQDAADGERFETEDYVDALVYSKAVSDELRCWNELTDEFVAADVPTSFRSKAVEAWCMERKLRAPDKTAVAQRVVNISIDGTVYDSRQRERLRSLMQEVRGALQLP